MPAHGVREGCLEKVVIAHQQSFQDLRQGMALGIAQLRQAQDGLAGDQQGLEGPDRPIRDNDDPILILDHQALLALHFQEGVIHK